jgi:hypothetical protein
MNPNSSWITKFLYNFGSYIAIAICLTLIVWSYVEPNFYDTYINGEIYLIWTVYIFPWVVIAVNIIWQWRR